MFVNRSSLGEHVNMPSLCENINMPSLDEPLSDSLYLGHVILIPKLVNIIWKHWMLLKQTLRLDGLPDEYLIGDVTLNMCDVTLMSCYVIRK